MNGLVTLVLSKARTFLGQMEDPPNSNSHPTVRWYNATIEYLAKTWNYCAAGVSRTFYETAAAKALVKPRAYVPWQGQDFIDGANAKAGGRLYWIDDRADLVRDARPGDVVFFDWDATKRHSVWTFDHVGIIEGIRPASGEAVTIEHNTSVPGTGNQGTTRKVRDARYIAAVGRPGYSDVPAPAIPKIPGTNLRLLEVDGDLGGKTILAWGTVMKMRGFAVAPSTTLRPDLVKAVQSDLRAKGIHDREGKAIIPDGKGLGSNSSGTYPKTGWTRTISALQIGHGVARSKADGVFDRGSSSEVKRIQRDLNLGGINDSPNYTG